MAALSDSPSPCSCSTSTSASSCSPSQVALNSANPVVVVAQPCRPWIVDAACVIGNANHSSSPSRVASCTVLAGVAGNQREARRLGSHCAEGVEHLRRSWWSMDKMWLTQHTPVNRQPTRRDVTLSYTRSTPTHGCRRRRRATTRLSRRNPLKLRWLFLIFFQ